jgi:hypothetical protein
LDVRQLVHRHYVAVSEIPCSNLGIDLYSAVGRNHFVRQFDSLVNRNALINDSIVLHQLSALELTMDSRIDDSVIDQQADGPE